MRERVTTQKAATLVNSLHEWVIALEGVHFQPSAVMEADRTAVERFEAGSSAHEALEAGKEAYLGGIQEHPMRVAVVDDESDVRLLLRLSLDPDRFQVVAEAGTGVDAIMVVDEQRPDAVVLDLNMPVLDGVEALKVIKQRWPGTNVIVHTAFGEVFKTKLEGMEFEGFAEKDGTFEQIVQQLSGLAI